MTNAVPVIETPRLRLRAFNQDDLAIWAPVMADPEVARYLGGHPFSREETWRRILSSTGAWSLLGYGYWAVERKGEGDPIGQIGFADFKRDMRPSIEGLPEMGWIFAPHAHGKGYATEAVQAALDWADARLKAPVIPAIIDHGNAPSIRLAERCGFAEREEATYRESPILLLRRVR
ncbi:MAG TPA: GNAT family N-acetyltransferase [Allosphingosinicella sp.]|nr:GNAT family N-acetyltransferase [Allosphingosinicella sp.]